MIREASGQLMRCDVCATALAFGGDDDDPATVVEPDTFVVPVKEGKFRGFGLCLDCATTLWLHLDAWVKQ